MHTPKIRAVIFFDDGRWIGQCLEVDLCTSSASREELPAKILCQLRAQMAADSRRGREPLSTLPKAPERFWRMYEQARPWRQAPRESWTSRFLRALRREPRLEAELALLPA